MEFSWVFKMSTGQRLMNVALLPLGNNDILLGKLADFFFARIFGLGLILTNPDLDED